ncbi:hypothetical protein G9A89_000474 [Geosiphon pyriformis]|nr:hypothetical protein G9A89_000474 [Geosiphon pyriformis]
MGRGGGGSKTSPFRGGPVVNHTKDWEATRARVRLRNGSRTADSPQAPSLYAWDTIPYLRCTYGRSARYWVLPNHGRGVYTWDTKRYVPITWVQGENVNVQAGLLSVAVILAITVLWVPVPYGRMVGTHYWKYYSRWIAYQPVYLSIPSPGITRYHSTRLRVLIRPPTGGGLMVYRGLMLPVEEDTLRHLPYVLGAIIVDLL